MSRFQRFLMFSFSILGVSLRSTPSYGMSRFQR